MPTIQRSRRRTPPTRAMLWLQASGQRQADFAAATGWTPSYISQVLRGVTPPSPNFKSQLSVFLGIPSERLFEVEEVS